MSICHAHVPGASCTLAACRWRLSLEIASNSLSNYQNKLISAHGRAVLATSAFLRKHWSDVCIQQTMYTLGPVEVELNVSAYRLWAAVKDMESLLPRVMPVLRASVEIEGDGGAGSIRYIKFPADVSTKIFSIERIDVMDDDTYTEVHTLIGGEIDRQYSFYRSTKTFTPVDIGLTVATWFVEYEPLDDSSAPEYPKQMFLAFIKAIEAYLVSHDDYA